MAASRKEPQTPPDPLSLALGRRVLELRETRGLSPAALAALAGMDANYLWRIEVGRQNLSFRNVARLAKAFDLTLSLFLETIDVSATDLGSRTYVRRANGDEPDAAEHGIVSED